MNAENFADSLKVGDEVAVYETFEDDRITKVVRVTKSQVFIELQRSITGAYEVGYYKRTHKKVGSGNVQYRCNYICEVTPELRSQIARRELMRTARRLMDDVKLNASYLSNAALGNLCFEMGRYKETVDAAKKRHAGEK